MLTLLMLAALAGQDASAPMSTAPTTAPTSVSAPFDVKVLEGSTASPDCGGRRALSTQAFCVSLPMGREEAAASSYLQDLEGKGWVATAADGARLVLVRRKPQGGCEGLQMLALDAAGAGQASHLAFGDIPVDVCAGRNAATPGLPDPARSGS